MQLIRNVMLAYRCGEYKNAIDIYYSSLARNAIMWWYKHATPDEAEQVYEKI